VSADVVLAWGNSNSNTVKIALSDLASANQDVVVSSLVISNTDSPANSTVGGYTNNSVWADDDYIYVALANGHIRRAAIIDF